MKLGSSPLSRGIRSFSATQPLKGRIIPALAGNTPSISNWMCGPADHPRSRGEYYDKGRDLLSLPGSSPLSRGIQLPPELPERPTRIIPALAGNTMNWATLKLAWRDHPRSRGEYSARDRRVRRALGSSPLSRGILGGLSQMASGNRIIPALAGNTSLLVVGCILCRDHPRSRGEYHKKWPFFPRPYGSSPLSRGIPNHPPSAARTCRIIPALAGNTATRHATHAPERDHPRSRGEYDYLASNKNQLAGSSPLSRGIPARVWVCSFV